MRFDHWAKRGEVSPWGYRYTAGEPVGGAGDPPECCVCHRGWTRRATRTTRSGSCWTDTCAAALLDVYGRVDVGLTRINLPDGRGRSPRIRRPIPARTVEKSTYVVADRDASVVVAEAKQLHQVVLRNLLKQDRFGLDVRDDDDVRAGRGSVAEGTFEFARAVAEGRASNVGLLFDHREAPAKFDARRRTGLPG